MSETAQKKYLIGVIGAGPAGLNASQYLARQGVRVVLFNRDIKPGGLVEYGLFPNKRKMRVGLKAQFDRILALPEVTYLGNLTIGQSGDLSLDQLRQLGFQGFMVATGAQINYRLGLPGESLDGVYQANDIVFHYNCLPGHSENIYKFGKRVAVIGVGNVMLDIVHYLKEEGVPRVVTAYARRGPAEVKFDHQALTPVADCLDMATIHQAVMKASAKLADVGGDAEGFLALLSRARHKAPECYSGLKFRMEFLRSPQRLIGNTQGRVQEIIFELNRLEWVGDRLVSIGTGQMEHVQADTVIFSIGSQVDAGFGLPIDHGNFATCPQPRFPVDGISYEVYNPDLCARCEDVFVSGWARQAGEGVVGLARKDAERGARALHNYLKTLTPVTSGKIDEALRQIKQGNQQIVSVNDLKKLREKEQKIALEKGLPDFKFASNAEMLRAIRED